MVGTLVFLLFFLVVLALFRTWLTSLTWPSPEKSRPRKSSPTFSVRPRSSVGRVTVDLIRRSWVRFPARSKDFFFTSCGSLIPFTRANAQWDIHGFISTLIYTSELILCFIICVPSATRHNIHNPNRIRLKRLI